tara:strand:- start:390 stop:590 length:201 start_codon:yes stop_codon:yes gene_type:complete
MSNIYSEEYYENKKDNSEYCYRVSAYVEDIKNEIYYDYEFDLISTVELIKLHHGEGRKVLVVRSRE